MSNHNVKVNISHIPLRAGGATCKFDWAAMKADYLSNRSITLLGIAKKYGCSHLSVKKHSADENWVNERAAINREVVRATTEANIRNQAKSQLQFNEDCLAESISLLESLKEEHARLKAGGELNAKDIDILASGLATIQKAGRLALGLSTNSNEMTGKDGKPLLGDKSLDELTAELIAVVGEEAFNLLNGDVEHAYDHSKVIDMDEGEDE